MSRFLKLIILLTIVSVLTGCTPGAESPTVPSTVAPATPVPIQATSTPPSVIVISPTPGPIVPELEPTPGMAFCSDARVRAAIEGLTAAVQAQDGAALAEVIDPVDGLDVYYRLATPPVHIAPDEIVGLFSSTFDYTWGDQAGSGLPVEGTFSAEILPLLLDVLDQSFTQGCQDLATGVGTGPTTALVYWPEEFAEMPFIALFRTPGPQDNELDWRTWALGFTVVDGQPKIRVLVQYFWEI